MLMPELTGGGLALRIKDDKIDCRSELLLPVAGVLSGSLIMR